MKLSPDQQLIAFGTMNRVLGIISARDGSVVRTFSGHTGGIRDLAWSPDMRRIATCSEDGSARVFDVQTGDMVARIEHGHEGKLLHTIDWSRDGHQLLTGGYDAVVRIWDATRSYELEALQKRKNAQGKEADLASLLEVAQRAARVGLAARAREDLDEARSRVSNPREVEIASRAVEATLQQALSDAVSTPAGRAQSLLQTIHDQLDQRQVKKAHEAYQELLDLEPDDVYLRRAKMFFSRGKWAVTWFPTQHDPVTALEKWRAEATSKDAVTIPLLTLSLPYEGRPPKELPLHPDLMARGPLQVPFGMIARGRPRVCDGDWTLKASGAGRLRISVGDEVLLEHWDNDEPFEISKTIGFSGEGGIPMLIEHAAAASQPALEISLEPKAE